jgi:probable HAF family extracellular repeat protein
MMLDLGTLGGTNGSPTALNNQGEVIGVSNLSGDQSFHPFLWKHGSLIDLYTNTVGGNPLTADAINDKGDVVGAAAFPAQPKDAYLWRDGVATDLGHLSGDCTSRAWAINSKTQVAAISFPCIGFNLSHAFLWENGAAVDLNTLITTRSGLQEMFPMAINDRSEIAGVGWRRNCNNDDGGICGHAFLLIPCDENHPGIEGCDYSMVEESASAIGVGSQPVEQNPTTATPWVSGTVNPMMRFFGHRSMPWYRNLGVQPPPK